MSFFRLDKPVQFLKGVGPVRAEALGRMGIVTARDLLYHVPRRYDDASTIQPIADVAVGTDATIIGRVRSSGVIPTRKGLRIFQAVLKDDSGMITCAWPGQPWLERRLRVGDLLLVTGPVKFFHGRQLYPREFAVLARGVDDTAGEASGTGHVFATYPASEEVPQWVLRGLFEKNLDVLLPTVVEEEYLSADERRVHSLPSLPQSLETLHRPTSLEGVEAARRRLAYDELFFLQLVQAQARYRQTIQKQGIAFTRTDELIRPLYESLPFRLTAAQARVLREIYSDMGSIRRMNRLLQGDVGSGKTVVALFSMLLAVEGGYQAALMAPTELLAEQHARSMRELMQPLGIDVHVLTGQLAAADRARDPECIAGRDGRPGRGHPGPHSRGGGVSQARDGSWWTNNTASAFDKGWCSATVRIPRTSSSCRRRPSRDRSLWRCTGISICRSSTRCRRGESRYGLFFAIRASGKTFTGS